MDNHRLSFPPEMEKNHFQQVLNWYQDKIPNVPEEVYEKLDKYFRDQDIKNITGQEILLALQSLNLSKYYENLNEICNRYLQQKLPTFTKEQFEELQKLYIKTEHKLKRKPKKDLYFDLDRFFFSHGLPTRFMAEKLPLKEDGTKPGTSVSLMYTALKQTDNMGYLSGIAEICKDYWGWQLKPDHGKCH